MPSSFESLSEEQKLNLAKVGHRLLNNPEVNKEARRLLSKADPSVRFTDLEVEDTVAAQLADRDKKIEELAAENMRRDAEQRRRDCHAKALERGLNPEDVEKAIVERGITNWETAMEFVERGNRLAVPSNDAGYGKNIGNSTRLPDGDDVKEFWNDPAAWANKQAHAAVDDVINARRGAR